MLKLKPNCEYCDVDLPPESQDARICSFECTFCASCVEQHLHNVCANCGGGLVPRPIRPANEHREGVSVEHRPASTERAQMKWTKEEVAAFVDKVKHIEPHKR